MRQFSLRAPIGPAKVLTAYSPPPVILSDLWSLVLFYCLRFFLSRPPFSHKEGLFHRNPKSGMHSRNSWTLSIILTGRVFGSAFDDNATVFYPRAFPERASGREEFEKTSKVVFQQIRGRKNLSSVYGYSTKGYEDSDLWRYRDCDVPSGTNSVCS